MKEKEKKVATATAPVNEIIARFLGNSGKSNDVYRKECFDGCTPKQKSRVRGKIRHITLDFMDKFVKNAGNAPALAELKKKFDDFYKAMYIVNDYTASSLYSANMSEENKQLIANGISVIKTVKE